MRIRKLHLQAYGPFTGRTLDFGDGAGLHLVYGENESGKSTTLRALSSLLFGYPKDTVDTWRHAARDVVVGALLAGRAGEELELYRRRHGGQKALHDGGGGALPEAALAAMLGGASRELFERVFALDHRRLEQHALALLSDDGSLGYSLFEAGAGISGVRGALDRLRDEAQSLFAPRASKPEINQSMKRLSELRREANQRMVKYGDYDKRERALREAEAEVERCEQEHARISGERSRLQRIARALPQLARRRLLLSERDQLGEVTLLAPGAAVERVEAEKQLFAAEQAREAATRERALLAEQIAAITFDPQLLARALDIKRLGEKVGEAEGFEEDLPKRRDELGQLREKVAARLRDVGEAAGAELATLLPPAPARRKLEALRRKGEKLEEGRGERAEVAVQQQAVHAARLRELAQMESARDVTALAAVLAAVEKKGDLEKAAATQERLVERRRGELSQRLRALGVVTGQAADLRALPRPTRATAQRHKDELAAIEKAIEPARLEQERQAEEREQWLRRLVELRRAGEVPSEHGLVRARAARDEAWRVLRDLYVEQRPDPTGALASAAVLLDPPRAPAEAYEHRVRQADQLADALYRGADAVAKDQMMERQVQDTETALGRATSRLAEEEHKRAEAVVRWDEAWRPTGLPALPPGEAIEWIARADELLAEADRLAIDDEERALRRLAVDEARASLATELLALGSSAPEGPLSALLERARSFAARESKQGEARRRLADQVADAERARDAAERAVQARTADLAAWQVEWRAALAAIGRPPEHTPEQAALFLDAVPELEKLHALIGELERRVLRMEEDRARFAEEARALGEVALPGALGTTTALELARRLGAMVEGAQQAADRLAELGARREASERALELAARQAAEHDNTLRRLCRQADCADPGLLPERERRSALWLDLERRIEELTGAIVAEHGSADLAAIERECQGHDLDQLRLAIEQSEARDGENQQRLKAAVDARAQRRRDADELVESAEQSGGLLQKAESESAHLSALVDRYAAVSLSEALLGAALERYRERNQGPILRRATELFARLTDGAYQGLQVDSDGKSTFVVAVRPDRATLAVSELSQGTADQLYLALRLAVIAEHNATREPLPFIADDLLVHFDDRRSRATFRALADLGEAAGGVQVLFFTHHAHMRELARDALGGRLREHQL